MKRADGDTRERVRAEIVALDEPPSSAPDWPVTRSPISAAKWNVISLPITWARDAGAPHTRFMKICIQTEWVFRYPIAILPLSHVLRLAIFFDKIFKSSCLNNCRVIFVMTPTLRLR
ncbi:hypothetical protein EVAR_23843_1 [Eumeta japonica]|uniref:Uncharacterized protein n=1 Tax=Eumeta variegata TaxID=151549 RepID=A0A4C1V3U3_EUMVA|nr:hypothetical protein EVAR_23843_1 [Eumeta japonica]